MEPFLVSCPECGEDVQLPADVEEGEIVECENCGVELDVTSVDPLEVMVFEEDEK
jgi:alpha-aminoadipate carrier protein LysW